MNSTVLEMQKIINQLLIWDNEYFVLDTPSVDDSVYDSLYYKLKELEQSSGIILSNSPTQKVSGEILPYLTKVKHTVPMLSTDKSTNPKDVDKFISSHNVVGSYKLDGSTVVLIYNEGNFIQALTRGSGVEGEDITHTAKTIVNIPMTIPYKGYLQLRGEALIPWAIYNELNEDGTMGHPRNVASGALRQLDSKFAAQKKIHFYAFTLVNWQDIDSNNKITTKINSLDFLSEQGFEVVPHELLTPNTLVSDFTTKYNRSKYENPTDGWVFEYNDLAYGDSLGSTGHHDRKMFALKPQVESYESKFRGIDYKVGRNGIVSLTAMFDPVEIDNTIITRASVHNVDIYNSFEFGEGDKIEVVKCNMIIPQITANLTRSNTYKLITKCPVCGETLIIKKDTNTNNLYCPNENCTAKRLAQFTHYVSKDCMNIDGLSEQTLDKLINLGLIKTYSDIYKLADHKDTIINFEGFGEKSYNNLIDAINKSTHTTLDRFINAIGIPTIGKAAAKTIAEAFDYNADDFMDLAGSYDFSKLQDFGPTMDSAIHTWYSSDHILDSDVANYLTFEKPVKTSINNDFIKGKIFVVTGKFNSMPRKELEQIITDRGGKLASSVSKNTSYLLTNDTESGSTKNKKAKELEIPIINEQEFLTKL